MNQLGNIRVFGTGITAHVTALLLANQGWRVHASAPRRLLEGRSQRDVRAYAINHRSRATLEACGVWPHEEGAPWVTSINQMRVFGDLGGQLTIENPNPDTSAKGHTEPVAWMVDVPELEDALREACRKQPLINTTPDEGDTPSHSSAFDLTVICEGRSSQQRQRQEIETDSVNYPHKAIAARVIADHPHGGVAQQWFDGERILALLPIGGAQGRSLAVVWSLPASEHRQWSSNTSAENTEQLAMALSTASHHALGQLRVTAGPVGFPLSVSQATRWFEGQTVLVGDAAHTIHPLAGQGLNLGLSDAQTLADCLAIRKRWEPASAPRLMQRYQRLRRADTQTMQWATHSLFHLFTNPLSGQAPIPWVRNAGLSVFNALSPVKHWVQRLGMGN